MRFSLSGKSGSELCWCRDLTSSAQYLSRKRGFPGFFRVFRVSEFPGFCEISAALNRGQLRWLLGFVPAHRFTAEHPVGLHTLNAMP